MTREATEEKIMEHLQEIVKIYHEYNPNGTYLTMSMLGSHLNVNNEYWEADSDRIINHRVVLGVENDGGAEA